MAMADSIWGTGRRLDECLYLLPYEFEFYQAVRLLNLMKSQGRGADWDIDDAIRFTVHPSLSFPPSPVVNIDTTAGEEPVRMMVAFLGLIGPGGVLPLPYSETAFHERITGNPSFAAFFDIFHHRLISLFYGAWEKHHFQIGFEKSLQKNAVPDSLTKYLYDLIGMGTDGLRGRLPFPDSALLRYAGLLAQRPHSAECLRAILCDFLGVRVEIEQFVGRWESLEQQDQCRIGNEELSNQLGEGTIAGDVVWTRQGAVRIVLGPLKAKRLFNFLPGSTRLTEAAALIRWYLGPTIEFEIQPVIDVGEVPDWCRLGEMRDCGPMLGWSSWLQVDPFPRPAADATFTETECLAARGRQC